MKVVDDINYLRIGEVGKIVSRTPLTIKRWFKWSKENGIPFPKYYVLDRRGTWFFRESDIPLIKQFQQDLIKWGAMSDFNRHFWGERGVKSSEDKAEESDRG